MSHRFQIFITSSDVSHLICRIIEWAVNIKNAYISMCQHVYVNKSWRWAVWFIWLYGVRFVNVIIYFYSRFRNVRHLNRAVSGRRIFSHKTRIIYNGLLQGWMTLINRCCLWSLKRWNLKQVYSQRCEISLFLFNT